MRTRFQKFAPDGDNGLWIPLVACAGTVPIFVGFEPKVAVGATAIALALSLSPVKPAYFAGLLVLSAFTSRLAVTFGGSSLRPEHFVTLLLFAALLMQGRGGAVTRRAFQPPSIFLLLYVGYGTFISLLFSESFTRSATILVWLALDWLMLACLLVTRPSRRVMYDCLAWGAGLAGTIALVSWFMATLAGTSFGVQRSLDNPQPAAYAFSFEANILAGFLLVSALALLLGPRGVRQSWHTRAAMISLAAIPTTQTRAAVLGLGAALLVMLFQTRNRTAHRRVLQLVAFAFALTLCFQLSGLGDRVGLFDKFRSSIDFKTGNGAYRVSTINTALGDLHGPREWIFGLGTNSFPQRHLDPSRPTEDVPAYLSNLPMQILYDTGICGLVLVALLALDLLRRNHFSPKALALMAAFAVVSMGTSPFWFASTWLFVALAAFPKDRDVEAAARVASATNGPIASRRARQAIPPIKSSR